MHHDVLTCNTAPHFLVYADYFRLFSENINTLHKNRETLLDMLMSGEQKVRRRNIQAANTSFGYVTEFKFLKKTLTN
jgi:hypothetical protein